MTTNTTEPRTYLGVTLWPADRNASGVRWEATLNHRRLRADTLAGIKALVKDEVEAR